ncbi:hypothetical protein MYAM1_002829 [Malassezia yamatoensis]|uniref:Uncharacterized protein n=1 Tax=Malassezia yamatoensis TaxID=253288 RepID=A0AAJ5YUN4_9BASI|nr:hypothetical protein MYAM1_002829 [Malassezia yamatoensis]
MVKMVRYEFHTEPPSTCILHTNREYTVGRKESSVDLCVPILRISRLAGTLRVGAMPADKLGDASFRPKLEWIMHAHSKSGSLIDTFRGKNRVEQRIRVETPVPLGDRTRIRLLSEIYLEMRWVPFTIGIVRLPELDTDSVHEQARACGMHLIYHHEVADQQYTHLCVAKFRANRIQLLALLRSVPIVTQEFFRAALGCSSQETLPDYRRYLPPLDPVLAPITGLSASKLLPDDRRASLFHGVNLIFVLPGRERRFTDYQELATAAGAHVLVMDMHQKPAHTMQDAQDQLRDAQHSLKDVWSSSAIPVLHPQTFVVLGDDLAESVKNMKEASHRLRLCILNEGISVIAECILHSQTISSRNVTDVNQQDHDLDEDPTLLISATPSGTHLDDSFIHQEEIPATQRVSDSVHYAGDISLHSPVHKQPADSPRDDQSANDSKEDNGSVSSSDLPFGYDEITDPSDWIRNAQDEQTMDTVPSQDRLRACSLLRGRFVKQPQAKSTSPSLGLNPAPVHSNRYPQKDHGRDQNLVAVEGENLSELSSSLPPEPHSSQPSKIAAVDANHRNLPESQSMSQSETPRSSTPQYTGLQRRSGTRQARPSFLMDELLGISGIGQSAAQSQVNTSAPASSSSEFGHMNQGHNMLMDHTNTTAAANDPLPRIPTPINSPSPPRASFSPSPNEPLHRKSFVQVRFAPLVRSTRDPPRSPNNFKRFRGHRSTPKRRIPLIAPVPIQTQKELSENHTLFLE